MRSILSLSLLATTAFAANSSPALAARQLVELPCSYQGMKECGSVCIDLGWTCCSSGLGGCPPSQYCSGPTACCPRGEVCTGPGGVDIEPGETITNTITNTLTNTLTNTATETATATEEEPTTEVVPPSSTSKPVIPTGAPTSSEAVPTPTPSASGSTTAPETPIFTGGAVANVIPGVGAVAGLVAALL